MELYQMLKTVEDMVIEDTVVSFRPNPTNSSPEDVWFNYKDEKQSKEEATDLLLQIASDSLRLICHLNKK